VKMQTNNHPNLRLLAAGIIAALALPLANCGGGGGTSATQNPAPGITSISPSSATAGSRAVTITVAGSNFITGSVIRWNGSARTTTYVSKTGLTGIINPADLATAGSAAVTVFNPTPGGGTSGSSTFTIAAVTPLAIATTQLPNAYRGKAYSYTLQASGGIAPYALSVVSTGSLPPGLTFAASTGVISGTPPTVSSDTLYPFNVQASDNAYQPNTTSKNLTILVKASSNPGRNDACSTATPISNGTIRASISPYGDIDVYSFSGTAGSLVTVEITARRLVLNGDPTSTDVYLDSFLEILNASCTRLVYNDDMAAGNLDSLISNYVLPSTGTYYLRVSDLGGVGRPDFIYDLRLSGAAQ
jgi:hypothetical protein